MVESVDASSGGIRSIRQRLRALDNEHGRQGPARTVRARMFVAPTGRGGGYFEHRTVQQDNIKRALYLDELTNDLEALARRLEAFVIMAAECGVSRSTEATQASEMHTGLLAVVAIRRALKESHEARQKAEPHAAGA
jgi:hypothetical protein